MSVAHFIELWQVITPLICFDIIAYYCFGLTIHYLASSDDYGIIHAISKREKLSHFSVFVAQKLLYLQVCWAS